MDNTYEIPQYILDETGKSPTFQTSSRMIDFSEIGNTISIQTDNYIIPYSKDIRIQGIISRDGNEENINDSIIFTLKAVLQHGYSYEIIDLISVGEYLGGETTPIIFDLSNLKGKSVSFIIEISRISYRLDATVFSKVYLSLLGITASPNNNINGELIDATDFVSKDQYTLITEASVDNLQSEILVRDREGDIATYRAHMGKTTKYIECSGYDINTYLDSSNVVGNWKSSEDGTYLTFDPYSSDWGLAVLKDVEFGSGYLYTNFEINEYGLAAGLAFQYYSLDSYWAIAVQRNPEGDDLVLINNGNIIDSIPLINPSSSQVSIGIEKIYYLNAYQIYVNEQNVFTISTEQSLGNNLAFFYREINNYGFSNIYDPVEFSDISITMGINASNEYSCPIATQPSTSVV